jgi:hypothetical protein
VLRVRVRSGQRAEHGRGGRTHALHADQLGRVTSRGRSWLDIAKSPLGEPSALCSSQRLDNESESSHACAQRAMSRGIAADRFLRGILQLLHSFLQLLYIYCVSPTVKEKPVSSSRSSAAPAVDDDDDLQVGDVTWETSQDLEHWLYSRMMKAGHIVASAL